jgi:hypothetical protein
MEFLSQNVFEMRNYSNSGIISSEFFNYSEGLLQFEACP